MFRETKKRSKKSGLPPGTLVHIGEKKIEKTRITLIDYDESHILEKEVKSIEECFPLKDKPAVTWINIDGIHQVDIMEKIGEYFGVHPLILEDILNTDQRPKQEEFETYIYIVLKMLNYIEKGNGIKPEQVSLIMGTNFVISFMESEADIFNPVRERIRNGKGQIRKMGADYLAYSLVDAIVDNYFIIMEKLGEKIEVMEEELITNPTQETLKGLHILQRELIFLRKSVWPLREVVNGLQRGESLLIHKTTRIYLRDIYDHTIEVIDIIEGLRDTVSRMLDIYLSSISNKLNEIMKVLTIIATIFIPLTFIAGVYGMNFEYMPELKWLWGYPVIWIIMTAIGILMLNYFRTKKWI
ncbi:MAG: magnesium/cobalt transporter CorA [Candidatus Methanoperedens sp.]|nr:magnesium/cobalt transporter CorA [Candidatus Methanoperedens sp.]MCZ7359689.1 magnesium/cobalt transporter CorA [Candidatus Methanoperedens sp.]HLB72327.1 magnesium/cobalt transporter CorA [Candidatus Methanoperedens sp.]